jgi:ABC-type transport system involved in multi-copper enzyme maturation permease subunit
MILSIFLPLFLALGLVRDETENGTLHYLLSKPIHRGEFITYRLLGYVIVAGGFVMALAMIMALVTSLMGPGDSLIRLRDIAMWMGIGFATVLALTAYGAIFNTLGLVSSKYGVYIALVVGVYEFIMAVLTLFGASLVPVLSVSHWTLQLVDSLVLIIWPDTLMMELQANAFGLSTGIDLFWNPPIHSLGTDNPFISAIISVVVLIFITVFMIWFGQRQFSRSEIM